MGRHILASFYGCRAALDDPKYIENLLLEAAFHANATPVNSSFHRFEPYGVSGVVIVQESHIAIHTWPEYAYAEIDVYTCGDHTFPERALAYIEENLKPQAKQVMQLERGALNLVKAFAP